MIALKETPEYVLVASIPVVLEEEPETRFCARAEATTIASNDAATPENILYRTCLGILVGASDSPRPTFVPMFSVPFHADAAIARELVRVYRTGMKAGNQERDLEAPEKRPEEDRATLFPGGTVIPTDSKQFPIWFARHCVGFLEKFYSDQRLNWRDCNNLLETLGAKVESLENGD